MAACQWSVAIDSRRGQQDPLWTQQIGGLTRKKPAQRRKCRAGEGPSSEGSRQEQELLWRQFFLEPALWWDDREQRNSSHSPDFRRKEFHEVLWLNNFYKPAWVDEQLAALHMQMGRFVPTSNSRLQDKPDPGRTAGYVMGEWAVTVCTICQQGKLTEAVEALEVADCFISKSLFFTVLKQCVAKKDLVLGRRVHALTVKMGYESDTFLCNHILRMYASHARLQEAMDVFTRVANPDAFMWFSIISAHVKHGQAKQAIQLYHQMRRSNVKPNGHVFVAALQACSRGADLETGQQVHADVLTSGVEPDLFVVSCLVDMYAKCGSLKEARRLFDGLGQKDVVTWTALIAGYSQKGMGQEALHLYSAMQEEGVAAPNSVTFVCLLQACASVGIPALEKGKQLHAQIGERGFQADVVVANSLINMYAKCGSLEDAQRVFDRLHQKDVVTWTALIAGYSQQGMGEEALHLFSAMQEEGIAAPDSVIFVCLLQACSRCGRLEDAQSIFDRLGQKDVVTWTAMIAGFTQQGMVQEALHLYSAMQEEGIAAPNSVTFVCLLQACASVAALYPGKQLHAQIEENGLQADVFVASSLINMYAKSGSMVDAQHVFDALPGRDVVTWNALIAGYTCQGDSKVVFDLVHRMRDDAIQPNGITFLSLLTACSHAGLVDKGQEYFEAMSRHHGITPTVEHYACLVDLLGRAGQLDEALEVVRTMAVKPNVVVWHALLGACRKWSNLEVGRHAFNEAVKLDEKDAAAHLTMCNMYREAQMWEEAQEMYARRGELGAWKQVGQSWWTDMSGIVHVFLVGDKMHPESAGLYARLKQVVSK